MLHVPTDSSNLPEERVAVRLRIHGIDDRLTHSRLHVLNDLEPYQCIESYCPHPDTTFKRLTKLREHYSNVHPSAPIMSLPPWTCTFCEEIVSGGSYDKLKHIARHMEEITFSIVPRQYEQWDFYTEASSLQCSTNRFTGHDRLQRRAPIKNRFRWIPWLPVSNEPNSINSIFSHPARRSLSVTAMTDSPRTGMLLERQGQTQGGAASLPLSRASTPVDYFPRIYEYAYEGW